MDRGAWWATVHGVIKSRTRLSDWTELKLWWDFLVGSDGKASAYNAGDLSSIPGLGRSPGEGNGNPFQYSCLENSMDGGAWWATVHGVIKSRTWLSDFTLSFPQVILIFSHEWKWLIGFYHHFFRHKGKGQEVKELAQECTAAVA